MRVYTRRTNKSSYIATILLSVHFNFKSKLHIVREVWSSLLQKFNVAVLFINASLQIYEVLTHIIMYFIRCNDAKCVEYFSFTGKCYAIFMQPFKCLS
jgi:hypothetical protein